MSEYYKDKHRYDDILYLPHYRSEKRGHMSLHDRAAQFAPFAALTGYEDAVEEEARLTEEQIILDETSIQQLNETLAYLSEHLRERISVSVTYFCPDSKKQGGAYLTDIGAVKKINPTEQTMTLENGLTISMERLLRIEILK